MNGKSETSITSRTVAIDVCASAIKTYDEQVRQLGNESAMVGADAARYRREAQQAIRVIAVKGVPSINAVDAAAQRYPEAGLVIISVHYQSDLDRLAAQQSELKRDRDVQENEAGDGRLQMKLSVDAEKVESELKAVTRALKKYESSEAFMTLYSERYQKPATGLLWLIRFIFFIEYFANKRRAALEEEAKAEVGDAQMSVLYGEYDAKSAERLQLKTTASAAELRLTALRTKVASCARLVARKAELESAHLQALQSGLAAWLLSGEVREVCAAVPETSREVVMAARAKLQQAQYLERLVARLDKEAADRRDRSKGIEKARKNLKNSRNSTLKKDLAPALVLAPNAFAKRTQSLLSNTGSVRGAIVGFHDYHGYYAALGGDDIVDLLLWQLICAGCDGELPTDGIIAGLIPEIGCAFEESGQIASEDITDGCDIATDNSCGDLATDSGFDVSNASVEVDVGDSDRGWSGNGGSFGGGGATVDIGVASTPTESYSPPAETSYSDNSSSNDSSSSCGD